MKFGTNLPSGVLRSDAPLKVIDEAAFQQLNCLLRGIASQLAALEQNPVVVATSPCRFDDANHYEWRAVRCGSFFSENGSYMRYDLDRDVVTALQEAKVAHALLGELEKSGWRDLFAAAFGIWLSDQSLSIVVQDKLSWLVFSSNNMTSQQGDPVFAIWEDHEMSYFGEAEARFDWAIQQPIPLVFLSSSAAPAD